MEKQKKKYEDMTDDEIDLLLKGLEKKANQISFYKKLNECESDEEAIKLMKNKKADFLKPTEH